MSTTLEPPVTAQPGTTRAVGRPVPRVDGPAKVKGQAQFAAEVPVEGLTYATIVSSTIARGRLTSIDVSTAKTAPGVVYVMTHENAPKLEPPVVMMTQPRAAGASDLPIMQDESIHWNGEAIAVVLAETQEQADYAASLVRTTYEAERAALAFDDEKINARPPESILGEPTVVEVGGDVETALRDAAVTVDRIYWTPRYNHCAIELHAATVVWDGDALTVHDATQMLGGTQWTLAEIFGIDEANVRILSPFVGGGFGGKGLWSHQILAIAAARESGRPVRIVLSREGVFRLIGGRTTTEQRVALGANADGTLAALIHTGHAAMTPHNNCPEQFTFPARHLYAASALRVAQDVIDIDMIANTFMRAPGESVGTFALESAVDELAEKLALDPIELRRRLEPDVDPASSLPFSSRHLVEAYRRGAQAFGWERRSAEPRSQRDGEWLIGHGVATATYPYFRMPGGSAQVVISADGRAVVRMASHEMGWAPRRRRRSSPPTTSGCRSTACASSTATPTCRRGRSPAARRRARRSSPRSSRRALRSSSSCSCSRVRSHRLRGCCRATWSCATAASTRPATGRAARATVQFFSANGGTTSQRRCPHPIPRR